MVSAEDSSAVARPSGGRKPGARLLRLGVLVLAVACLLALTGTLHTGDASAQEDSRPVEPAAVRDDVRDVMSGSEYDYSPSVVERVMEWIADQLAKLFDRTGGQSGGTFGGGIGALFGWLVIIAAVVAIIAVVVWVILNRTRRAKTQSEPVTEAEVEHRRRADEWMADAERLEAAGEWKEAMRARYRHLVRTLVDRRQLPDVPGRTTGELRDDLLRTTPDAAVPFDTCCLLFELAWYAGLPTGPDENARIRSEARRVLGAPVEERFEPLLLAGVGGTVLDPDDRLSDGPGAGGPSGGESGEDAAEGLVTAGERL